MWPTLNGSAHEGNNNTQSAARAQCETAKFSFLNGIDPVLPSLIYENVERNKSEMDWILKSV